MRDDETIYNIHPDDIKHILDNVELEPGKEIPKIVLDKMWDDVRELSRQRMAVYSTASSTATDWYGWNSQNMGNHIYTGTYAGWVQRNDE